MGPSLFCLAAGSLAILLRRPWARNIKASQEFWFDRTYDVDGLAWWIAAMGGLVIAFGVVFLAIWVIH
jgi:hypothetical protein